MTPNLETPCSDAMAWKVSGEKRKNTESFRKLSEPSEILGNLEIKYIHYFIKFSGFAGYNFDYRNLHMSESGWMHVDASL